MTAPFTRIVVAVDGSPASVAAVKAAASISAAMATPVILAHILQASPGRFGMIVEAQAAADAAMSASVTLLEGAGGQLDTTVISPEGLHGVAWGILDIAKKANADLVCVGTSGHGPWGGAILGSVSQRLLNHCPCPVLVVPAPST